MEKTDNNKGIFTRIYDWFKNLTFSGLLRFIIIIIVIVLILMSLPFLPKIISSASSSLSAALYSIFVPAENATMTADKKIVNSGEDFNVIFNKGDATDGIFSLSYTCDADLNLFAVENTGLKNITCNKPYYILSDSGTITLRPNTTNQNVFRLVLNGALENNETQKIEEVGVVRITIKNDSVGSIINNKPTPVATTTTVTNNPPVNVITPPYVPSQPAPVYYGKPDLAVRILQTGILNQYTNQIVSQTQFNQSDMIGIKFEIRNDGDANTGTWYFSAFLPSTSNPVYASTAQISLRPGESIIYTLGFSNLANQGINLITVKADQNNSVYESNENNNTQTSTITSTNNNNSNGCYINGYFTYNCNNSWNGNDGVDLAVEILKVGRINSSGNFVEDDTINEGDTAAIRFKVTNEGNEDSDRWDYEVALTPSFTGDNYVKHNMPALDSGESVTVTVEFENVSDTGTNRFRVEIDPDNDLDENETDNNDATETIRVD